jgi:hypothetical protein
MLDLAATPQDLGCPMSQGGQYTYKWSKDCRHLYVTQLADQCTTRKSLLATSTAPMTFVRQPCPKFHKKQWDCKMRPGALLAARKLNRSDLRCAFVARRHTMVRPLRHWRMVVDCRLCQRFRALDFWMYA